MLWFLTLSSCTAASRNNKYIERRSGLVNNITTYTNNINNYTTVTVIIKKMNKIL